MTVLRETSIHRYVGLAGDTRPTGVPAGSTYLAYDTDALEVTYDGTNWVQIDRLVKLVAGTANIGDVDVLSIAAGTNNIGDVDVLSIAAGTNIIGKVGIDQTTPGTTNAVQPKAADGTALFAVPPQLDDTDKQAVSLYAKKTTAGDTSLELALLNGDLGATGNFLLAAAGLLAFDGSAMNRLRSIGAAGASGDGHLRVGTMGELITLAASAARTESANGTAVTGLGWRNRYILLFDLTVADTDAGDTLDVYVDVSLDGTTWLNAVHFTQIIGTDSASKRYAVLDPSAPGTSEILVTSDAAAGVVRPSMFGAQMRARWAITDAGADDASFTFSVTGYAI